MVLHGSFEGGGGMLRLFGSVVVASILALGAGLLTVPAAAATSGWTQMNGPSQVPSQSINEDSLDCVSSTFCMAVGVTASLTPPALVEPSEVWNGTAWTNAFLPVPTTPAHPTSVSCLSSSFCITVGYVGAAVFADEWNGAKWSQTTAIQPPTGPWAVLWSVTCITTTDCISVGQEGNNATLAEQWNGSVWSTMPTPVLDADGSSNLLSSVSCVDGSDCWAVGELEDQPLAEHFDGSTWSEVPTPAPAGTSSFSSVSCVSTSSCQGVGLTWLSGSQGGTTSLTETWDGSAWTVTPNPIVATPGQNNQLNSVDCISSLTCVAVGSDQGSSVVLDFQSGEWLQAPSPAPIPGATSTLLGGISCVIQWDCVVLADANTSAGQDRLFFALPIGDLSSPTAVISSPNTGGVYALNQGVPTAFSCFDGIGGPGISTCIDSAGSASPGMLDTSAYGSHTYSVTATSSDGMSSTSNIDYWVANAPTAFVSSPSNGAAYVVNQEVPTTFSCSDGTGGPGISSCVDSNGATSGGPLKTNIPGLNSYSVTATSADGLTQTTTVDYTVIGPPNAYITNIPLDGEYLAFGQTISLDFACQEFAGGPGIASCVDSNGSTSPGTPDTSTLGVHTYSITATSSDGLTYTRTYNYTVALPPTATITSPTPGGTYALGQFVPTSFSCTDSTPGAQIIGCSDSNNQRSPGYLDTSTPGPHTYYVSAESSDALSSTTSLTYTVAYPDAAPLVTQNPSSQSGYAGTTLTFVASATGNPAPTVQWQHSANKGASWVNYPNGTSTSLTTGALTTSQNGWEVRAVFTNAVGSATTSPATITVQKDVAPAVTLQPTNTAVKSGTTATFTASASGSPAPTVQWQVSTNAGSTWSNVSGATSTTLQVAAITSENGWRYRAVFTNPGGTALTKVVTLRVS
jgi:hypothetical protein